MTSAQGSIFITGANGGLGSALVTQIVSSPDLAANYHGIYTVRNVETATSLEKALVDAPTGHKYDEIALDLSKLQNVSNRCCFHQSACLRGLSAPDPCVDP
jgi:Short-chain dehydrogenases of various substrate specificities